MIGKITVVGQREAGMQQPLEALSAITPEASQPVETVKVKRAYNQRIARQPTCPKNRTVDAEIVKYEEAFTGMVVGSSGLKPTMKPAPTTDRAKLRYA